MFKSRKAFEAKRKRAEEEAKRIIHEKDVAQYTHYITTEVEREIFKKYNEIKDKYFEAYNAINDSNNNDTLNTSLRAYLDSLNELINLCSESRNIVKHLISDLNKMGVEESVLKEAGDSILSDILSTEEFTKKEIISTKEAIKQLENHTVVEASNFEKSKVIIDKIKSLIRKSHSDTVKALKNFGTKLVRYIAVLKSAIKRKIKEMANKKKESK